MSIEAHYIAHSGDDLLVVNAARVSFAKRSAYELRNHEGDLIEVLGEADCKLLRYLATHHHWTPFAHPTISLHIRAPIFVRTQCFKHKVGFVENEVSRRYVDDTPNFFSPDCWRERAEDKKQGSGRELKHTADLIDGVYERGLIAALQAYERLLELGVAPEQARAVLPQSTFTEWFWTGSLAAWARFFTQRTHPNAQAETSQLAHACAAHIAPLFPHSWPLLTDHTP